MSRVKTDNKGIFNKKFVEEFINIQQSMEHNEHKQFVVDLDVVIKWMGVEHNHYLKKALKTTYNKNIDYILLTPRGEQKGNGAKNKQKILLTIECFKKVCLRSKSKISEKIIDYYLTLEKLVTEHQNITIGELMEKNKLPHSNLDDKIYPKGGLIYVIDLGIL